MQARRPEPPEPLERSTRTRAIDDDQKLARRAAILASAQALYLQGDGSLPSVAQIASHAGLGKGTMYLYFRTKEEIFIALLDAGFAGLLEALREAIRRRSAPFTPFTPPDRLASGLLEDYLAWLRARPEFLKLASLGHGLIGQGAEVELILGFKLNLARQLLQTGERLAAALQLADAAQATALLTRTYALTLGLWQSIEYPAALKAAMTDPALQALTPEFHAELTGALQQLWRGALLPPAAGPPLTSERRTS